MKHRTSNPIIQVVVVDGPDAGRTVSLTGRTFTVGTSKAVDLCLTDDRLEGVHLNLTPVQEGVQLRDLSSVGGTWLGSVRIQEVLLTQSATVVIGRTTLSIQVIAPIADSASAPAEVTAPTFNDLAHLPYREARAVALTRFERAYIPSVLARSGNVVVDAAKSAGVERESFYRMLGRVRGTSSPNRATATEI